MWTPKFVIIVTIYVCNYFLLFKNVFYFYLLIDLFFVIFSSVVLTQ